MHFQEKRLIFILKTEARKSQMVKFSNYVAIICFFRYQEGEMLYARVVELSQYVAYPLFSISKVTSRKSMELGTKGPETMLPMRRKKSLTISHTQHRTTPISTTILTKEKEWGFEKKTGGKLKKSKLVKLN